MHTTPEAIYADKLGTQMRKGLLVYHTLLLCGSAHPLNTSDIMHALRRASLAIVAGTMYPLLNRLQKDGLLTHEWRESSLGPPRKYYRITDNGQRVLHELKAITHQLQTVTNTLEGKSYGN